MTLILGQYSITSTHSVMLGPVLGVGVTPHALLFR